MPAVQVFYRLVITAAESFAVSIPVFARHVGMAEIVMVVSVWSAVMVDVVASGLDAIVKALSLDVLELLRWSIPIVVIAVLYGGWVGSVRGCVGLRSQQAG